MSTGLASGKAAVPKVSFTDVLSRDHHRLDAMLASLLELVHADLHPQLEEHWTVFEEGLVAHLDAEEMFMLPELAKHDAAASDAILAEHARLRELLAEVGVGLDLHIVREPEMLALARVLRAHAEAEMATVYKWADEKVPTSYLAALSRRLKRVWDRSWFAGASDSEGSPRKPAPVSAKRGRARL